MNKESILTYLTNAKETYKKEGFLIKALFGSYSRDEANENSDVDILVSFLTINATNEQINLRKTGI